MLFNNPVSTTNVTLHQMITVHSEPVRSRKEVVMAELTF